MKFAIVASLMLNSADCLHAAARLGRGGDTFGHVVRTMKVGSLIVHQEGRSCCLKVPQQVPYARLDLVIFPVDQEALGWCDAHD